LTNLVARATASADELDGDELRRAGRRLARKVRRWRPTTVAFLGLTAYRIAFDRRDATVGAQADRLGGAGIWLLPNPSGAHAYYRVDAMVSAMRALHKEIERSRGAGGAARPPVT